MNLKLNDLKNIIRRDSFQQIHSKMQFVIFFIISSVIATFQYQFCDNPGKQIDWTALERF